MNILEIQKIPIPPERSRFEYGRPESHR